MEQGGYRSLRIPAVLCLALAAVVLGGGLFWPLDPLAMDFTTTLAAPSLAHPMGTDATGRDVLARFLAGGRLSLLVGTVVMFGGLVPGALLGLLAARTGGALDLILMRIIDGIAAFPPILLAMAVAIGLGGGLWTAVLGVAISTLPFYARLMRSEVLRVQSYPFVEAAESMGASPGFILVWHIAPHAGSTMLVQSASVFGYAIITLAGLGFVGLGAQIPTPEWGVMITGGMQYALTGQWWLTIFPGFGILFAVVATNLLADRLSDVLGGRGDA
ncbi:MAG: ABC transporter permease [Albidovulum sp.]|nr:ABC transporter permease [Albidovulum sp.]MDE0533837.1 ABC transporter permease [Albidovulum sp.]